MPLRITTGDGPDIGVLNRWADGVEAKQASLLRKVSETKQVIAQVQAVVGDASIPNDAGSASVSQTGYIGDGVLYSEITTTYSAPNPLGTFAGVFLVIQGYRGSSELVKISEHTFTGVAGGSASFKTLLQRTNETVTLFFVAKNSSEAARDDWQNAPSATVTLNGGSIAPVGAPCPVTAPVTVANALTNGGGLGQFTAAQSVSFPGVVVFDVQSTGGIVDVLLWASTGGTGPNGYFLRFDGRNTQNAGQLLVVNNGTWSAIGTAKASANTGALTGWHHVEARISTDRVFDIFVDGVWQATAQDSTFTPTGATYYGYEVVANPVLATPDFVNRTIDHVGDGTIFAKVTTAPATGLNTGLAVDVAGNLKLKNTAGPTPTTNSPTTSSSTYAVIPEMTTTITTKGNKVLLIFTATMFEAAPGGANMAFSFFRDGSQINPSEFFWAGATSIDTSVSTSFLDSPSAASHTYDVRWRSVNNVTPQTAVNLARLFQVVELG